MNVPPQSDPALNEFAKFANAIGDPQVRRAFDKDPLGTLKDQGVNVGALPQSVVDFLTDLSYEELRMLANLQQTMVDADLKVQTVYGAVGHL